jgi:hypothetical protein
MPAQKRLLSRIRALPGAFQRLSADRRWTGRRSARRNLWNIDESRGYVWLGVARVVLQAWVSRSRRARTAAASGCRSSSEIASASRQPRAPVLRSFAAYWASPRWVRVSAW